MTRSVFRLLALVGVLVFAALPAVAQIMERGGGPAPNAQITGQVRLKGGQPAYGVLVSCERTSGGLVGQVQTDRNGRFRFGGLLSSKHYVSVRLAGYVDDQRLVDLRNSSQEYLQFILEPDGSGATPTASAAAPAVIDAKVPPEAQKEYESALASVNQGQSAQSIPHLERAVALHRGYTEAYLLLGTAYMDTQQWDKAEAALKRAIELNPKATTAHYSLGQLYQQQKKYQEAERAIKDGLKIEERSWQGHYALGRLYWEMNEVIKAGREVAKTLQLKPDLAEAHLLGGNILLRARKNADALYEFEEYLRLDPNGKFAPQTRELVAKIQKALTEQKK